MTQTELSLSAQTFREGLARLGAAVNIVTSDGPAGRLGFTATAICSVSDSPPSLLVCMNRRSQQNEPLKQNGVLCVNTLAPRHQELSQVFSGAGSLKMTDRFDLASWFTLETGSPVLSGAVASFDCRIVQAVEVNTHSILITEISAIRIGDEVSGLIYLNRRYHDILA